MTEKEDKDFGVMEDVLEKALEDKVDNETNHIERLVLSFERIASALEGINGTGKSAITKLWPEPAGQREVIVSKVETEAERVAREQGKTIPNSEVSDWLSEGFGGEEELVGEREREFLTRQKKIADEIERKRKSARNANLDEIARNISGLDGEFGDSSEESIASTKADTVSGPSAGGAEEASGEGGGSGEGTADKQASEES